MKRLFLILLIVTTPLYAAMSDAQALKNAKTLWGNLAMIGTSRDVIASNWTKNVGVKSIGCDDDFTILGKGFNTWDNAFADYVLHPVGIAGPFKGTVNVRLHAADDVAVTKVDIIVDSAALNVTPPPSTPFPPPAPNWDVVIPLNTNLLSTGLHLICGKAEDGSGKVGGGKMILFNVDQTIASSPNEFRISPVDLRPAVSVPEVASIQ